MGLFSSKKKVISYEILFGDHNKVSVGTKKEVSEVPDAECIRLWAFYQAKIIYNLGYPKNLSAMMAFNLLDKILENDIDAKTNCFQRAEVDDVIQYSDAISSPVTRLNGEFFAEGSLDRSIKTHFPMQATEQQVVFSSIALLQYCIIINKSDHEALKVITKTARNLLAQYEAGMGSGLSAVVQIPQTAYLEAIGSLVE